MIPNILSTPVMRNYIKYWQYNRFSPIFASLKIAIYMGYIVGFTGSNSSASINHKLVRHTGSLITNHEVKIYDMSKYPFPMYSEDHEKTEGFSDTLVALSNDLKKATGILISVNEHNSNPSAYFKNVMDWLSRVDRHFIAETSVYLMATSTGKYGAKHALDISEKLLLRFNANVIATFSFPNFSDNFKKDQGITNAELAAEHQGKLQSFLETIS